MVPDTYEDCFDTIYNFLQEFNYILLPPIDISTKNVNLIIKFICKNLPPDLINCSYDIKLYYISKFDNDTLFRYVKKIKDINKLEYIFFDNKNEIMDKLTTPRNHLIKKYNDTTQSKIDKCNKIINDIDDILLDFQREKILIKSFFRKLKQ